MNKQNVLIIKLLIFVLGFFPIAGNAVEVVSPVLFSPISSAMVRVTKKPFAIKVSPENSPVQPEKFFGYHTGTDFEALPGEENEDTQVFAVCDGTMVYKGYAEGYGGMAVEKCKFNGEDVTVLYGHLKLSSVSRRTNGSVNVGDKVGVLGNSYSRETAWQRKHLHLGMHKGMNIDLRGYVENREELKDWINVEKFMISSK